MKKSILKKINLALIAGALATTVAVGGLAGCTKGSGGDGVSVADLPTIYSFKEGAIGSGKTYYVAPEAVNGDDTADGSEEHPYNVAWLLASSNSPLEPGDTVLVKDGIYELSERILISRNGENNKYITVKAADPTKKSILSFYSMAFDGNARGVQLDANYWYWYDVDICGAGDNGMYIGGSYNIVENCEFYDNRDSGLQLGRKYSPEVTLSDITEWPSYNLIKNCTSYNNYDNETAGENADGFAAKLTIGYGNIFDGCIAYRNSDDGWDLFAKTDTGNIGAVILYNCVAFENGYLLETQEDFHKKFPTFNAGLKEPNTNSYLTRDGDGNGFKLGGSVMEGDVYLYNCLSFNNRMHGVTDNSNPGVLSIKNVTAYNNSAPVDNDPDSDTFGHIVLEGAGVDLTNKNGNINLARQEYSYNLMSHILSVTKDSSSTAADEYRGSVEYSYFDMGARRANKIETYIDASNRAESYAVRGTSTTAISADIFEQLPATWTKDGDSITYTYELSGKGNNTVHDVYHNKSDGSINMKQLFKITDYSGLFGDDNKIGSDLSKSSWDEYTHYSYYNPSYASDDADVAVKAAISTLDLNTQTDATFQDFDLLVKMKDVTITWTSSDTNIIKIDYDTYLSPSGTHDARAIVYRQAEDVKVVLTAVVKHNTTGLSMAKQFEITVKNDVPTIGEAVFAGVEDGRIILDMFDTVKEPEMVVLNAADYNGKILDPSVYNVETTVEYSVNKNAYAAEIHHFSTNIAGVYTIHKRITMGESTKTFSYMIYVASAAADVDFVGSPSVMVNQYGYSISGELSSPTGKLYAYSSKEDIAEPTAEQVISGGKRYVFRDDKINLQFENANTENYFIYYVMTNLNDDVTTEVGKIPVTTVEIDTVAKFKNILLNSDPSTIYTLTADLDLSGESNWVSEITEQKKPFVGVLNGLGHTISGLNVTVSGNQNELGGMFYKVAGGTIENVKFKDINISGNQKTGIVATTEGGYFYNISMENVNVVGTQRVGGLIGQASTGDLYVDQVSLVNPVTYVKATSIDINNFAKGGYHVKTNDGEKDVYTLVSEYVEGTEYYKRKMYITGQRSGGIIGFIQASSALDVTHTYISNCFVDSTIGNVDEQYQGGIVGSADDRNVKDYLQIDDCYSIATVMGKTYVGGILGSHNKGTGSIAINNCVFFGSLYYSSDANTRIDTALKNCSGIVGRSIGGAIANVKNCYAKFADSNSNFDVDGEAYMYNYHLTVSFWEYEYLKVDQTRWEILVNSENSNRCDEPFLRWKFLGEWD